MEKEEKNKTKEDVLEDTNEIEETQKEKGEEPKEKKGVFSKKENKEVVKLKEENKMLQEKVLRITAEMQNMRRRMEEEKGLLLKYEGEELIKKILPSIDNLERAIGMDDTNLDDEVSKFLSGFKMIYGNLNAILASFEVVAIDVLNKPFDPNTMEAVMTEEVSGVESNMVIDVLQKGYTYKGKVIRHAMVKVSK